MLTLLKIAVAITVLLGCVAVWAALVLAIISLATA